jgi:3'-5' exonuclease
VKIGHGIMGGDIPALFRDFGIIVVNAFDTQEASGFLGRTGVGLAALLDLWGCPLKREIATLKDRMKHADWRLRPLTDVMLRYATLDVHYLVSLYKLQVRELLLSSVACMGKGDKTGYQGQDGIPLKKRTFPPKGKGNISVPKECSSTNSHSNINASQEKSDGAMKKKETVVTNGSSSSGGGGGGMRESVDDDQSERLEVNDDSLAVHMLLDIKNRGAATAQDNDDDDDEDDEGAEVWGLDPAVEVEVGMDGNTSSNNNKSKLNYVNDRFHNEAGGDDDDDDDDIGEAEDDENGGILVSINLYYF